MLRVVLYHHIADECGPCTCNLGVRTSVRTFVEHINYFRTHYNIVDLKTVLSGVWPRRALLITFDDYYASIPQVAAPILVERGLPAVFFVCPTPVESRLLPLDNAVSLLSSRFGVRTIHDAVVQELPAGERKCIAEVTDVQSLLMNIVPRLPYRVRAGLEARLCELFGVALDAEAGASALIATRRELQGLPSMGIELGNHTASHVHCRTLDVPGGDAEVLRAREAIEAWIQKSVVAFSYPYGDELDATPAMESLLQRTGHAAAFLVHGRLNSRPISSLLYRVSLGNLSVQRLYRALEVLPRLRMLSHRVARGWRRGTGERSEWA